MIAIRTKHARQHADRLRSINGHQNGLRLCCRDASQAALILESFGLAVLDSDGIGEFHERTLIESADALSDGLSDKAMQIHLQRIARR